jgi:hypothetical protein
MDVLIRVNPLYIKRGGPAITGKTELSDPLISPTSHDRLAS